jgi:Selenoprotein, putative
MSNFTTEARRRGEDRSMHRPALSDLRGKVLQEARNAGRTVYALLRRAVEILKSTICEIFDESAYDRFLARTRSERSVSSYREFMRERENAMARKQRCC